MLTDVIVVGRNLKALTIERRRIKCGLRGNGQPEVRQRTSACRSHETIFALKELRHQPGQHQ